MEVGGLPEHDGAGLTIVVNPSAGPLIGRPPSDVLREGLPAARIVEVEDAAELPGALRGAAADGAKALGIAGGDGSVNSAAEAALHSDLPLAIFPTGTLNHLARDLGLVGMDAAIEAFRHGTTSEIDVSFIDERPFLNTASLGGYVELVDRRERLERRFGKWPAFVVAFVAMLFRGEPMTVEIDGMQRRPWIVFFGNCRYEPRGIAPRTRSSLDDGRVDVRILDSRHGWARLRLVALALVGRAHRARGFEERSATSLGVRVIDGATRLSRDGETSSGSPRFEVTKSPRALRVFLPSGD